jgi:hypothetical protein
MNTQNVSQIQKCDICPNFCPICMEEDVDCITPLTYNPKLSSTYCSHYACKECWSKNPKDTCFICRADLPQYFPKDNDEILKEWIGDKNPLEITKLDLDGMSLEDLTPLAPLTNLKQLNLTANDLTDVSPLSTLVKLEELNLNDNQMSDLSSLSSLLSLTRLFLSSNAIIDLSPLSSLVNLEGLMIRDNQISDISTLSFFPKLDELQMGKNNITDLSPLATLANLTDMEIDRGIDISLYAHIRITYEDEEDDEEEEEQQPFKMILENCSNCRFIAQLPYLTELVIYDNFGLDMYFLTCSRATPNLRKITYEMLGASWPDLVDILLQRPRINLVLIGTPERYRIEDTFDVFPELRSRITVQPTR